MADRLFVAVIGSGTRKVDNLEPPLRPRGPHEQGIRKLWLDDEGHTAEVFLISGSNEERKKYAKSVLEDVDCRIVLCSVQYVEEAFEATWNYIFSEGFMIYAQWLNPGHNGEEQWDRLGLVNRLLQHDAVISLRDGRTGAEKLRYRVEELRQFIHGWASARGLVQ